MDVILLGIPIGIVMLYFGSEWLVKGAKSLALKLKVTPFVVGLTVVAFGSSAPEMITSVVSVNNPELILGNVIGSNIANIGLAIGLAALICPMAAHFKTMEMEVVTMVVLTGIMAVLVSTGMITFSMGATLFAFLLLFLYFTYKLKKNDKEAQRSYTADVEEDPGEQKGYLILIALIVIGLVLLYFGARFFVDGAVGLARMFGISKLVIGLIVVALGTSLPEICICLVAAKRGENELAVSNIVGSNIFNICAVLGLGAMLTNIPVPESVIIFHMPVLAIMSIAMFIIVGLKDRIGRASAALFLAVYIGYIAMMFLVPSLSI